MAKNLPNQSEMLNQQILDSLNEGILVVDEKGIVLNFNQSLSTYQETETNEGISIGSSVFEFIKLNPEYKDLDKSLIQILQGKTKFQEHQILLKDHKWYGIKLVPLSGDPGAVISIKNINTRKSIEIALETSLKKYRNIYNKAPVMMHSIDAHGKIISVSDFWLEKMGYERNEIIGKSPKFFVTKEFHKTIDECIAILVKGEKVKNVSFQFTKKNKEKMDVILSSVGVYDDEGDFERSIAGMIDVTEQKKVETDLNESRIKLLESQRISKIGNYELDVKSGAFKSSIELDMIMGFDSADKHLSITKKLIHPDDFESFTKELEECIKKKKDFFYIYRIINLQNKKLKWISGRGKMILNNRGVVTKMIGTIQDITEQRAAQDKIKKLSDRILLSTEIANLGVWEYSAEHDEVIWEDQMFMIFPEAKKPYRLEELKRVIDEDEADFLSKNLELIKSGINFIETEVKVRIAEEARFLRTFTRVIRKENDQLKGLIGVVYDITEDKKLQTDLEVSLDEKNILIREVHHRVKNNMQLISSIMALKAYDLKDEEAKVIFEDVNTRIKAMSVIYDKLHKFYNVSEIDISDFLTQISKELGILLGIKSIQLNIDVLKEKVSIDHALVLGLIVSELVSNAIKHSFKNLEEGNVNITMGRENNEKLYLTVTNDGKSLPENILTQTTGIGMSMIKTFVRQLKGELSLAPDNGLKVEF